MFSAEGVQVSMSGKATVKPIVDVTRFMLAAIATCAAMAMAFMRVRRAMRR